MDVSNIRVNVKSGNAEKRDQTVDKEQNSRSGDTQNSSREVRGEEEGEIRKCTVSSGKSISG